jgi:hypothetical protein
MHINSPYKTRKVSIRFRTSFPKLKKEEGDPRGSPSSFSSSFTYTTNPVLPPLGGGS